MLKCITTEISIEISPDTKMIKLCKITLMIRSGDFIVFPHSLSLVSVKTLVKQQDYTSKPIACQYAPKMTTLSISSKITLLTYAQRHDTLNYLSFNNNYSSWNSSF